MSVFVSFRGSDRNVKNKVVNALREKIKEENIWESDEGCTDDFSSNCLDAIKRSSVFVVIISDKAMEPSYVINEVITARECENLGTLNIVVYKITNSPYTSQFGMQLNHLSYINPNLISQFKDEENSLNLLVNRVNYLLNKRKNGNPEKPYDVMLPIVLGIENIRTGYFVKNSRNNIFEQISENLMSSNILFLTYMDGYGKKSTIYKWFEINNNRFKHTITISNFYGSLKDFFIYGLKFKNINEERFNNLSNEELILDKISLLNRINEDTVIIVPNINIDVKEDQFIIEMLTSIKCKMIFIAENVVKKINDMFPVLEVKNMENQYLKELFYHYYGDVTKQEAKQLDKRLEEFFDSIGGHTKSVEITATTIASELGIYPEDIPEILEKIYTSSDNELSNIITSLINNLFDINEFSNSEKEILKVASLIAINSVDEKLFIEILKECGIYDSIVLKKMLSSKWLDNDRQTRTIYIEKLLSKVCLSKKTDNDDSVFKCISFFYYKTIDAILLGNKAELKYLSDTLYNIFTYLNMNNCANLIKIFVYIDKFDLYNNNYILYKDKAYEEITNLENEEYKNIVSELINLIFQVNERLTNVNEGVQSSTEISKENYMNIFFNDDFLSLFDYFNETKFYMCIHSFLNVVRNKENGKIILEYINACQNLINSPYKNDIKEELDGDLFDSESKGMFIAFVKIAIEFIVISESDYLKNKIIKNVIELIDEYNFVYLSSIRLNILTLLFDNLTEEEDFEKANDVYESLCDLYEDLRKDIFDSIEEETSYKVSLLYKYMLLCIKFNKYDKIISTFKLIKNIEINNDTIFNVRFEAYFKFLEYNIKNGTLFENIEIIEEEFNLMESLLGEDIQLFGDMFSTIKNIIKQAKNSNKIIEYKDYYSSYEYKEIEKELNIKYDKIASICESIDYSNLTHDLILEKVQYLKNKALNKANFESIAAEAFALVSEVGYRLLGYKHHHVQYIGACAIFENKVAEIYNGEGKTYTIVLAAFLKALYGKKVHIIDTSVYLAERNYNWMCKIFEYLGLKVGLLAGSVYHHTIKKASEADIIYSTVLAEIRAKNYYETDQDAEINPLTYDCAIFDEADNSMIDCGMKTYSFHNQNSKTDETSLYEIAYDLLNDISNTNDYFKYEDYSIKLLPKMYSLIEEKYDCKIDCIDNKEIAKIESIIRTGIYCMFIYEKNKDYIINENNIYFEDKKTGYLTEFNNKYKYFLAKKESMFELIQSIKIYNYNYLNIYSGFELVNLFKEISGATATAISMNVEFKELYNIDIVRIPSNLEVIREDHPPLVFTTYLNKINFVINTILNKNNLGQPVLVICGSIYDSKVISDVLTNMQIKHQLLNGENSDLEAEILIEAGMLGQVCITTSMANRGVDIKLGGDLNHFFTNVLINKSYNKTEIENIMNKISNKELESIDSELIELYNECKQKIDNDKEKVEALGGLCVIGTECFDDLRIDQQIRGRAGRQGQKGESYIVYSLEDQMLCELLGPLAEKIKSIYEKESFSQTNEMTNAITLGRTKKQHNNLTVFKESNSYAYYQEKRRDLYDLIDSILYNNIGIKELIKEYICNNSDIIDAIKAFPKETKYTKYIKDIYHLIPLNYKENNLSNLLYDVFMDYKKDLLSNEHEQEKLLEDILKKLKLVWINYVNLIESEINSLFNLYRYANNKEEILKRFSDTNFKLLRDEVICNSILEFRLTFTKENIVNYSKTIKEHIDYFEAKYKNMISTNDITNVLLESYEYVIKEILENIEKRIDNQELLKHYVTKACLSLDLKEEVVEVIITKPLDEIGDILYQLCETQVFDLEKKVREEQTYRLLQSTIMKIFIEKDQTYLNEAINLYTDLYYNKINEEEFNSSLNKLFMETDNSINKGIIREAKLFKNSKHSSLVTHSLMVNRMKRIKENNLKEKQNVGPNSPCPCGSGKKYKHCCGIRK